MTWAELVSGHASVGILPKVHRHRGVPKKTAQTMLTATFNVIAEQVLSGDSLTVPGFGTFYRVQRKARRVRNPKTGEMMMLPERTAVGFRMSKAGKR